MKVKIKLLPGGKMPEKAHKTDAAYDCFASESCCVNTDPVKVPLGFAIELPESYYAEIIPRSSIGLKTPLRMSNSVGIIDSGYVGEVNALYEAKQGCFYFVQKGEKICQMLIHKVEDVEFVEVKELSQTERGDGGFGSTGK